MPWLLLLLRLPLLPIVAAVAAVGAAAAVAYSTINVAIVTTTTAAMYCKCKGNYGNNKSRYYTAAESAAATTRMAIGC